MRGFSEKFEAWMRGDKMPLADHAQVVAVIGIASAIAGIVLGELYAAPVTTAGAFAMFIVVMAGFIFAITRCDR